MMTHTLSQRQYITNWHDSFVNYIGSLLGVVAGLMARPEATEEDMRGLDGIRLILNGRDAAYVERRLAEADVKQDVLDRIEKLNKDLVDMAIEHLSTEAVVKEFLKKLTYYQIEQNKRFAEIRLKGMQLLK